jgi:threonine/homoserine/homoserine lactone efflux protein
MLTYAMLAARGAQSFRASGAMVWLERIFGAALMGFSIRLAFDRE